MTDCAVHNLSVGKVMAMVVLVVFLVVVLMMLVVFQTVVLVVVLVVFPHYHQCVCGPISICKNTHWSYNCPLTMESSKSLTDLWNQVFPIIRGITPIVSNHFLTRFRCNQIWLWLQQERQHVVHFFLPTWATLTISKKNCIWTIDILRWHRHWHLKRQRNDNDIWHSTCYVWYHRY